MSNDDNLQKELEEQKQIVLAELTQELNESRRQIKMLKKMRDIVADDAWDVLAKGIELIQTMQDWSATVPMLNRIAERWQHADWKIIEINNEIEELERKANEQ